MTGLPPHFEREQSQVMSRLSSKKQRREHFRLRKTQTRACALNPASSASVVADARQDMEEAAFRRDRLQAAVTRLGERYKQLCAEEEDQRRWVAYEKAKEDRDHLASELIATYPVIERTLVNLLTRVAANDKAILLANGECRPNLSERLFTAEMISRDLSDFNQGGYEYVPRLNRLRLPAFKFVMVEPYAWPKS